jgi:hypothetical protein
VVLLEGKRLVFSNLFSALRYLNTAESTSTSGGDNQFRVLLERIDNQSRRGCFPR